MDLLRIPPLRLSLGHSATMATYLVLLPLFLGPAQLRTSPPSICWDGQVTQPNPTQECRTCFPHECEKDMEEELNRFPSPSLRPVAWVFGKSYLETSLVTEQEHLLCDLGAKQEHLLCDQLWPCICFPTFPTTFPFSLTLTWNWLNCPNFCLPERL